MKTHFYNRTLLPSLKIDIPESFIKLDEYYNLICPDLKMAYLEYKLKYTENIARRFSDIRYYEFLIKDEYHNGKDPFIICFKISCLLVGFYNSIKSFIDAIAIALNDMLELKLKPIETDLCRDKIWEQLPENYNKNYGIYKTFFNEVKIYRNAASHRMSPNAIVCGPTSAREGKSPSQIDREDVEIRVIDHPENDINVLYDINQLKWISPLLHIDKWNCNIEALRDLIIEDIQSYLIIKSRKNE